MTRASAIAFFAAALACPPWGAAVSAAEAPAATGRIRGSISPGGIVTRVCAVDRNVKTPLIVKEVPVKEHEGQLLRGGAEYEIRVPPGVYDLHFELRGGTIVEGADTRVDEPPDARPLTAKDRASIETRAQRIRTFENEKSVLEIHGAGTTARAIVKLVRTNPTSYDGEFGEPVAVFRWEVWEFKKQTGSWVRDRTVRVLRRFLIAKRKMSEMTWEFTGRLGGVVVEADRAAVRDVDLTTGKDAPTPDPAVLH